MLSLSAILAIVITVLAALHITYNITTTSIVPKLAKSKQKQQVINEAILNFMKNAGVDTTKISNK